MVITVNIKLSVYRRRFDFIQFLLTPFSPLFCSFNLALSRAKHSRARRKRSAFCKIPLPNKIDQGGGGGGGPPF